MNTEHTPGPWRVGNGSFVIADHPAPGITGADDVAHYGGHLICESVNQANARLIAAAPDLLEALTMIAELQEKYECSNYEMAFRAYDMRCIARTAIAKAEGKA